MINHIRSILWNAPHRQMNSADFLGEEYVSLEWVPVPQPHGVARLRDILFGHNPDRALMNYRLRQLMTLIHSTDLEQYVHGKDTRVTYWPGTARGIFDETFGATVTDISVSGSQLTPVGTLELSRDGQLYDKYIITVSTSTAVIIDRKTKPHSFETVAMVAGQPVTLPGTQLQFMISNPQASDSWELELLRRPAADLGTLVKNVETNLGAGSLADVFGPAGEEPYKTFKALWEDHQYLDYKLGGLTLALAYRMDETRQQ